MARAEGCQVEGFEGWEKFIQHAKSVEFIMLALYSLLALATGSSVLGGPIEVQVNALEAASVPMARSLFPRSSTSSSNGKNGGFYYSWYADGNSDATYTNYPSGKYTVTWSRGNRGNFVGGKGWEVGSATRVIKYSGTYQPNGNSYLAVYGWTSGPLVEYYVVESFGSYNPSVSAKKKGEVQCDDGVYDILMTTRTNAPSIEGIRNFVQFWSVRRDKRVGGVVTMKCHVDAWNSAQMFLGATWSYQIVATEGLDSSGSSAITVS